MRTLKLSLAIVSVLLLATLLSACQPVQPIPMPAAQAAEQETQEGVTFEAVAVTGLNRRFGQPLFIFDFAPPPFDHFGFQMVDVYNPDGAQPLPLTAETPDDAILATTVDPFVDEMVPVEVVESVDPTLINVPIRDVETWTVPDLPRAARASVPYQAESAVVVPSQAEPNFPITKGDWLKASGTLNVVCSSQENRASLEVRDLIPNRLYTVWMIWLETEAPAFHPLPFGGTPNVFLTDEEGNATFERTINFCPMEAAEEGIDGMRLAFIETHLHSDHVAYGGVPLPLLAGFPPGTVLHGQLAWHLGAGVPASESGSE